MFSARLAAVLITCLCFMPACGPAGDDGTEVSADSTLAIEPLKRQVGRFEDCGVESYKMVTDAVKCGTKKVKYQCDETYQAKDLQCPGSLSADVKEFSRSTGNCQTAGAPESCPAGYTQSSYKAETKSCGHAHGETYEVVTKRVRRCVRDEFLATCNRVRTTQCTRYDAKTCEDTVNGAVYSKCPLYLSNAKTKAYIGKNKPRINQVGLLLVGSGSKFHAAVNDEVGAACLISSAAVDPLQADLLDGLKADYEASFGQPYDPDRYDCSIDRPSTDIDAYTCEASNAGQACTALRSYRQARLWLTTVLTDVTNLLSTVIAKDLAMKTALKQMLDAVNSHD